MAKYFRNFNYLMFAAMLALIAIGTVAIWSAGNARSEAVFHGMWRQTLTTAILGLAVYIALSIADYRKILEYGSLPAYAGALVLLVAVLVFGGCGSSSRANSASFASSCSWRRWGGGCGNGSLPDLCSPELSWACRCCSYWRSRIWEPR